MALSLEQVPAGAVASLASGTAVRGHRERPAWKSDLETWKKISF